MAFDLGIDKFYFEIDLSKPIKNIDLTEFPEAVERGFELGVEEVSRKIYDKLVENMIAEGLGGSELIRNIVLDVDEDGIFISVNSEYACYVEFGTGIVGDNNQHPHPWEYDVNEHGEEGWFYIGKDGRGHFTSGSPSRPFMYNTWLWATRSCTQIIRKNIRREIRKIKGVKCK